MIHRLLQGARAALLLGSLLPSPSLAADAPKARSPLARGAIVGGSTLGIGAAGATVGALAGLGYSVAPCSRGVECYPPVYAILGGSLGGASGVAYGAARSSRAVGARPGRTLAFMGADIALGFGVWWLGEEPLDSVALSTLGTGLMTAGVPLAAGLAAATDRQAGREGAALGVAPAVAPGYRGAALSVRF